MFSRKRQWITVYYKAAKIVVITLCFRVLEFPSWFFQTLTILYILYPLFYYFWEKRRFLYYSVIGLLMVFPFLYNEITVILKAFLGVDYPITGAKTMYSIVYFLLGNVLFRNRAFSIWKSATLSLLGMALLLFDCIILSNFYHAMSDGVNGAFPTLGAFFLAVGVFECLKSIDFNEFKWISFFSQGVLPIYLFHVCAMKYCFSYFGKPTNVYTALMGSFFICITCCCVGWVIKKVPILCSLVKI